MIMDGATNDLRQSGIVEGALNVGGKIPRFVLSDALGKEVNVEDLLADGPLVMTFYRGGW
jgi:peroxiredoxin